ncbi:hypothetical protein [Bhargavaea massiliensis]|uniref:hypothetical protein n=1 Tax=Bhargavaea massiliensis TaxID=2697500 RepID=UPI001BCD35EF|nr:hypothetical protein [Bhargavaea massiliensis]
MLKEQDVFVLRTPLVSGLQSPMNLSGILVLGAFLQAGLYALEFYVIGYSSAHPLKNGILKWHFWTSLILIGLGIVFALPIVYRKFERLQYLISIVFSQNLFGVSSYILALLAVTDIEAGLSDASLMTFTKVTLFAGIFVFLLTFLRYIWKIRKGDYRRESRSEQIRKKFEYKSSLPAAAVAGLGLFFILQYVLRNLGLGDPNQLIIIFIGFAVFYTMCFVLPEQLIILYCKLRFSSFNFKGQTYLDEVTHDGETEKS